MAIFTTSISDDDHLWAVSGIPWLGNRTPSTPLKDITDDVLYLLVDPHSWIASKGITYLNPDFASNPSQQEYLPVELTDHYFISFRRVATSSSDNNIVQGIHRTGLLSVCPEFGSISGFAGSKGLMPHSNPVDGHSAITHNPFAIQGGIINLPGLSGEVEITLVKNTKRAYLHLQLGRDKEEVAKFVMYLVQNPDAFYTALEAQFAAQGVLRTVLSNGHIDPTIPVKTGSEIKVRFATSPTHEVFFESRKETAVQQKSVPQDGDVLACNADIGTYIQHADGSITILVEQASVKMY